jgi:hypothetical protein
MTGMNQTLPGPGHFSRRQPRAGALRRALGAAAVLALLAAAPLAAAEREPVPGSIAIFPLSQPSIQLNALADKSAESAADAFSRLGRFLPRPAASVQKAMEGLPDGFGEEDLRNAAARMNADLFAIISVTSMGSTIVGTITIRPVSPRYSAMNKSVSVRAAIPMNIPLKLAREIALMHRHLPLEADILEKREGLYLLSAGQWQGLSPGQYRTSTGEMLTIRTTGRYRSLAAMPESAARAGRITIRAYPSPRALLREIDNRIEHNTYYRYSLENANPEGGDPEKKFATGMCLINPGANACMPGYGSYLSTAYMGFKSTTPSVAGIVFSSLLIVHHFLLPEYMTKFKINFFPGVMDSDKTTDMNNLQIFLWSTIPLTVSVAYLDQLAFQFTENSVLPPFFYNKNEAALVLSLIIPGGGMFYKGHRIPAWGFHLSEMFLAGFCVYTKDEKKKVLYGGIALGAVKLIDLVSSYFSPPSYSFYNLEKEGRIALASPLMSIDLADSGEPVLKLGISCTY